MNEIPHTRQRLLEMIEQAGSIPGVQPLPCSSWLAKSLLQKSIRRGLVIPAFRAALTLMQHNSRQLWSRLCVIAFEDVGFGDIESVSLALAAADTKVRTQISPDRFVAAALISHLCTPRNAGRQMTSQALQLFIHHWNDRGFRSQNYCRRVFTR
jgi:hypothetical protein